MSTATTASPSTFGPAALSGSESALRIASATFFEGCRTLERLRLVLGHSSMQVIRCDGRLVRDQFSEAERDMVDVHVQPGTSFRCRGAPERELGPCDPA